MFPNRDIEGDHIPWFFNSHLIILLESQFSKSQSLPPAQEWQTPHIHPGLGTDTSTTSNTRTCLFWVMLDKDKWKSLLDRCSQTLGPKSLPTLTILRLDLFTFCFSVQQCVKLNPQLVSVRIQKHQELWFGDENFLDLAENQNFKAL